MSQYQYVKSANLQILESEIRSSNIITALDTLTSLGTTITVTFKATLSNTDETTLNTIIDNHVNIPSPEEAQLVQIDPTTSIHSFALDDGASLRARLVGIINTTATKNSTTNHDYQVPTLSYNGANKKVYMNGIEFFAKYAEIGDKLSFQVVDVNNILGYGAGVVLDEFGKDWYVAPDILNKIVLYKAHLIAGLFIRVVYTSTGTTNDVKLVCNLFRHMDTNINT